MVEPMGSASRRYLCGAERISDRVISSLGGVNFLVKEWAAAARRKPPSDLTAYDLSSLAIVSFEKGNEQGFLEAIKYCDEAIAKDPHLTRAYITKAYGVRFVAKVRNRNWVEALNESDKLARKAIEIDPYDATAHMLLGLTMMESGNRKQSAVEIDRALELNPSSADIIMLAAYEMAYFGRPEEGANLCDRAFRLNPLPPPWYPTSCEENYFFTKRYAESVDMVRRALEWRPKEPLLLGWLAAGQIELGAVEDATKTVAEWKQRFPDDTVEGLFSSVWFFERKQEEEQLLGSLTKAGAPICVPIAKLVDVPKLKHLTVCDDQRAKQATQ
jgi:tetratricopeptide (TPR) repeat protein